jgi:hypothetical protein
VPAAVSWRHCHAWRLRLRRRGSKGGPAACRPPWQAELPGAAPHTSRLFNPPRRAVGWYHAHPTFPTQPSKIDIYNQVRAGRPVCLLLALHFSLQLISLSPSGLS